MQMFPYPQKRKQGKCYPEFKAGRHLELTGEKCTHDSNSITHGSGEIAAIY